MKTTSGSSSILFEEVGGTDVTLRVDGPIKIGTKTHYIKNLICRASSNVHLIKTSDALMSVEISYDKNVSLTSDGSLICSSTEIQVYIPRRYWELELEYSTNPIQPIKVIVANNIGTLNM